MVRKRGFEPLRSCERQPLKLVRLPFRHFRKWVRTTLRRCFGESGAGLRPRKTYFGGVAGAGAGAGGIVAGAGLTGAAERTGEGAAPLTSEPGPR